MTHDEHIAELISAYVDGAVTEDERQRAEEYLRLPEWRQYYEDLLAVREDLRSLPVYHPSQNIAEVLAQRMSSERLGYPADQGVWNGSVRRPLDMKRSRTRRKVVVWAVGVAATLLVGWFTWHAMWNVWRLAGPGETQVVEDSGARSSPGTRDQESLAMSTPEHARKDGQPHRTAQPPSRHALSVPRTGAEPAQHPAPVPPAPGVGNSPAAANSQRLAEPTRPPQRPAATEGELSPFIAMVMELVLTDKGIEERVVERCLQEVGIPAGQAIPLDPSLERVLLASRVFGAVQPDELPAATVRPSGSRSHFQLMFVVGTGRQFDSLLQTFSDLRATGDVAMWRLDLAMGSGDSALFSELDKASHSGAATSMVVHPSTHPLVLSDEARNRLADALATANRKSGSDPLPPPTTASDLPAEIPPARVEDVLEMENLLFKVLFIVRSEAEVRRPASP